MMEEYTKWRRNLQCKLAPCFSNKNVYVFWHGIFSILQSCFSEMIHCHSKNMFRKKSRLFYISCTKKPKKNCFGNEHPKVSSITNLADKIITVKTSNYMKINLRNRFRLYRKPQKYQNMDTSHRYTFFMTNKIIIKRILVPEYWFQIVLAVVEAAI